jgi:hypothetical protein
MLNRDAEFIFLNALTQGSRSLREATLAAFAGDQGPFLYEFGGTIRRGRYRRLPRLEWWMVLVRAEPPATEPPLPVVISLERVVPGLQARLNEIDASLAALAADADRDWSTESGVRATLKATLEQHLDILDASYTDPQGVLRFIEPGDYRNFEGTEATAMARLSDSLERGTPVLSGGFPAFDGSLSVMLAHPVVGADAAFQGTVSAQLRPGIPVGDLVRELRIPEDYELWVMQPDGLIVYDPDRDEVGRNLFQDPLYAERESLLALGRQIAEHDSGEGRYIFTAPGTAEDVIKDAVWQSVSLHGQSWRVVLAYRPYE